MTTKSSRISNCLCLQSSSNRFEPTGTVVVQIRLDFKGSWWRTVGDPTYPATLLAHFNCIATVEVDISLFPSFPPHMRLANPPAAVGVGSRKIRSQTREAKTCNSNTARGGKHRKTGQSTTTPTHSPGEMRKGKVSINPLQTCELMG
jgi:hypothetical protein